MEERNHCFENEADVTVTADMVLGQAERYVDPGDSSVHLYGDIIAALRGYRNAVREGRHAENSLALAAHYIGDLAQPFHNISCDAFNQERHGTNDGIVNAGSLITRDGWKDRCRR